MELRHHLRHPVHDHRAEHLGSPATRLRLARGLRDVVERAEYPRNPSAAAPVARTSVLANRNLIAELANRLDSDLSVAVDGIDAVRALLTDPASPLWIRGDGHELHDSLEAAMIRLGL